MLLKSPLISQPAKQVKPLAFPTTVVVRPPVQMLPLQVTQNPIQASQPWGQVLFVTPVQPAIQLK
jgi:hypothetical protein